MRRWAAIFLMVVVAGCDRTPVVKPAPATAPAGRMVEGDGAVAGTGPVVKVVEKKVEGPAVVVREVPRELPAVKVEEVVKVMRVGEGDGGKVRAVEGRTMRVFAGAASREPIEAGSTVTVEDEIQLLAYWPAIGAEGAGHLAEIRGRNLDREMGFLGKDRLPLGVRVTYEGHGAQYCVARTAAEVSWSQRVVGGPKKVLVEGLDESGTVVGRLEFVVARGGKAASRRNLEAALARVERERDAKGSHESLLLAMQELALEYFALDDLNEAWATIQRAEKDYGDAMKGRAAERVGMTKWKIAVGRGDLKEAIAAAERVAAAGDREAKVEAWRRAAQACLMLGHDYKRAKGYWEKAMKEKGAVGEEWPYFPKVSDVR